MALFAALFAFLVRYPAGAPAQTLLSYFRVGSQRLFQVKFLAFAHRLADKQATVTGKSLLICDGKG
jgi:hypothetical protein